MADRGEVNLLIGFNELNCQKNIMTVLFFQIYSFVFFYKA